MPTRCTAVSTHSCRPNASTPVFAGRHDGLQCGCLVRVARSHATACRPATEDHLWRFRRPGVMLVRSHSLWQQRSSGKWQTLTKTDSKLMLPSRCPPLERPRTEVDRKSMHTIDWARAMRELDSVVRRVNPLDRARKAGGRGDPACSTARAAGRRCGWVRADLGWGSVRRLSHQARRYVCCLTCCIVAQRQYCMRPQERRC